jgi:hypothetical protein
MSYVICLLMSDSLLLLQMRTIGAARWLKRMPLSNAIQGRITSVSGMVFMRDSERAAELANNSDLDVGLHLNFSEEFTVKRLHNNFENTTAG